MTAEIAILNRSAVTLAADSAMTIRGGSTEKVYNSVDKIFELSNHDPIGIMIYNTLEFMRVPLELIIKRFRESSHCEKFLTIEDAATAFFDYLQNKVSGSEEDKKLQCYALSYEIFGTVRGRFNEKESIAVERYSKSKTAFDLHDIFLNTAEVFIRAYESIPRNESFSDVDIEALATRFVEPMDAAIRDHFGDLPLDETDKAFLYRIAALWMCSDVLSDLRTGFVFAGYGHSQIFPSLIAFECDGLIGDAIKKRQVKTVHIDRISTPAEVVPFAQHEMVDRFLYAIDPEFEKAIEKTLEKNLSDIGTALIGQVRLSRRHKADLEGKLKEAVSQAILDFREESVPRVKREFWNQIRDTVLFMTKPDLANFAESLVNITSIKRRVSLEQETVGGPIDVAVIPKSDGFVWVKRKYYFDGAINHRFFERKRAILAPALRGDKP